MPTILHAKTLVVVYAVSLIIHVPILVFVAMGDVLHEF